MENISTEVQEKLNYLLDQVQKSAHEEEYIYGVTDTSNRTSYQKLNDFLINHSAVPLSEKSHFYGLLATMLNSGISLYKGLKLLAEKSTHPRLKRIISTLASDIEHGRPLSQAMEKFPDVFQESECGSIRSAEATGTLEQILLKTADSLDRRIALGMKIASALIYPIVVLFTLIAGIIIMFIWVIPRMRDVFALSNAPLPFLTRALLAISGLTVSYWWIAIIALALGYGSFLVYINSEEGKFSWDFNKLRIPLIGPLLRKIYVLRFVDTLGILIDSGVPITKALEFTAKSIGNEIYRLKTYDALARVQEGVPLSSVLIEAPFLFPMTVANMIAVAEQSASIGHISIKISRHYDREISHSLKNMSTTLGPLLIVLVGVGVGLFAIAVLSPIFSLTQSI